MKTILITGSSGFIGYHLVNRLLKNKSNKIIGVDNMNDNYENNLKEYRLNSLKETSNYLFYEIDINDKELDKVFSDHKPDIVINLAAKAGVRSSNNKEFIDTNILGFCNVLELCNKYNVKHFIYASSSSVYGNNLDTPWKENSDTNHPLSIYASTKKCDEILSYTYSRLYNIKVTGLRFFTVYGPVGRPDMAYYDFTNKLINRKNINVFNNGSLKRDFTYIDDIVEGIIRVINKNSKENYNIYNLGNEKPIRIMDFINILKDSLIEEKLLPNDFNIDDYIEYSEIPKTDAFETYSNSSKFYKDFKYKPNTSLNKGIKEFVKWYKDYSGV